MIIRWIIAGAFLTGGTYWDLREKRIPGIWMGLGMILGLGGMIHGCLTRQMEIGNSLTACLPGALFLLISAVTREQMGSGDGLALLVLGGLLGAKTVWFIWLASLGIVFLFGMMILILKKGTGKTQIAFFPFLLVSYLLVAGGMG